MIDRYTISQAEASIVFRRRGRIWELVGLDDKRIVVSDAQRERLRYIVIRDLIRNGPLETLLSDEMLEDIHSVGLKHIHMDHKVFGMVTSNIRFREREILSRYLRDMSDIGRPVLITNRLLTVHFSMVPVSTSFSQTTFQCWVHPSPFVSSLKRPFLLFNSSNGVQ